MLVFIWLLVGFCLLLWSLAAWGLNTLLTADPQWVADLGELAGWLIWGQPEATLSFRTGGLCRVTMPDRLAPATGDLRWLLPPRLLRRLG